MILSMIREPSVNGATLSSLFFGAIFLCDVLEDEIREIVGRPVSEWKIKGRTAIPAGTYSLSLVNSPRFGPETITLDDVPGYDYIRMHGGNKADDTDGCLLPGSRNSDHTVAHSQDALRKVRELVVPHLRVGGSAYIEIVNPPGM
jgi:hypothetical protein